MMRWLDRWRISRALDEGTPLPAGTRRRLEADPALRRHRERLVALGSELAREARAAAGARRPLELTLAARAPRAAPIGRRLGLALAAAAALALVFLATRRPDGEREAADARTARAAQEAGRAAGLARAGVAREPAAPLWSSVDRLARRTQALSPSALGKSGEEALVQEARNVARDARQLASRFAARVSFARSPAPEHEPN